MYFFFFFFKQEQWLCWHPEAWGERERGITQAIVLILSIGPPPTRLLSFTGSYPFIYILFFYFFLHTSDCALSREGYLRICSGISSLCL